MVVRHRKGWSAGPDHENVTTALPSRSIARSFECSHCFPSGYDGDAWHSGADSGLHLHLARLDCQRQALFHPTFQATFDFSRNDLRRLDRSGKALFAIDFDEPLDGFLDVPESLIDVFALRNRARYGRTDY